MACIAQMLESPQVALRDRRVMAKGRLEGIIKMVDDRKGDLQVLRQILAVHAQLETAHVIVIEGRRESFMAAPKPRRKEILPQIRESLGDRA